MRAIWKGAISFGLVSIPVKLYAATEERSVAFHQVHRSDGGRIRYQRICSVDGEPVAYGDIAKGIEAGDGDVVVLTDEDLADLPLSSSREIDVEAFVPLDQVDPMYFAKSYYLEPDKSADKPYVLLQQALEESGMVALVKVAIRSREALAVIRNHDGVLVLATMIWPDEIRTPDFDVVTDAPTLRKQELAMARSLVESMAGDFDPSAYHDDYREALQQVIDAKLEGREVVELAEKPSGGQVLDLMAALKQSVAAAKQRRGGPAAVTAAVDDPAGSDASDAESEESARGRRGSATGGGTSRSAGTSKSASSRPSKSAARSNGATAKRKSASSGTAASKGTAASRGGAAASKATAASGRGSESEGAPTSRRTSRTAGTATKTTRKRESTSAVKRSTPRSAGSAKRAATSAGNGRDKKSA